MAVKGLVLAGPDPVEVANRSLLGHALDALERAGIQQVAVAAPAARRRRIEAELGGRTELRVLPAAPEAGIAGALVAAAPFVGDDPFVLHAADGLLRHDLGGVLDGLRAGGPDALLLVYRNRLGGAAPLDGHRILRLVGAAGEAEGLALAGAHVFGPRVLRRLRATLESAPCADVATLAEHASAAGMRLETRLVDDWCRCGGGAADLLELNRAVLDDLVVESSTLPPQVHGRVSVHPSAQLHSAVVRGPAVIGAGARITDAYVGPYTAIGDGAVIENCEVENSIVLGGAQVRHAGRIEGSVVGRGARVHKDFALPRAARLVIGDGAEVVLP